MSFFHRPGDSSSEEESSEDDVDYTVSTADRSHASAKESTGSTEDVIIPETAIDTLSLTHTISHGEDGNIIDVEESRSIMIASMLEELTKYRAAELLNKHSNGEPFDRHSPQVTEFAKDLFDKSSGILHQTGMMSREAASDNKRIVRNQYLSALERASYTATANDSLRRGSEDRAQAGSTLATSTALIRQSSQQAAAVQSSAARQLQQLGHETNNLQVVRPPSVDLQLLSLGSGLSLRGHYELAFEERSLLGKGGFGKVHRSYNVYDQREYAVKKIPLSPKLSEQYRRGGLTALNHVLREVQALARLDHCHIVRYHAAWIEEPIIRSSPPPRLKAIPSLYRQQPLLLDNKPASQHFSATDCQISGSNGTQDQQRGSHVGGDKRSEYDFSKEPVAFAKNDESFDPFLRSGPASMNNQPLWSQSPPVSGIHERKSDEVNSQSSDLFNYVNSSYVLFVQMTLYDMTLADYLAPLNSPHHKHDTSIGRHCFHLLPSLQLLLGVLRGLQYIHAHGYVHRDIKPTNIFLSHSSRSSSLSVESAQGYIDVGSCQSCATTIPRLLNPRIGDFGLVADLEKAAELSPSSDSCDHSGEPIGTQYYRPPIREKEPVITDEKIDVFALGVIFLELLWPCQTRMERMNLLRGCQSRDVPSEVLQKLLSEGLSSEIIGMVESCIFGMIDPNAQLRWSCAMVKNAVEAIHKKVLIQTPGEEPD